ncbi:hydroxymethylbilane synthase [Breznakibacter xylanolyticus]|uniref:Porphobilinogen deaminase n=1 Tax=Breznakibacter xylanolyticus TaxID=990 RepID=A0A2W7P3Z2_9BACT|nr:hydroxymethylbilane synthase [Breznakibacter xylanolyticus]PZX18122.1 hydroxymethylbilane synthase [Breznakibacter xylanolyticus]
MSSSIIYIGTRGSKLALWQANHVKALLETTHPQLCFELKIISTKGDRVLDVALSKIGDKGLFTRELEDQLFDGHIHMAVHSLKDLPTVMPQGTRVGAILSRGEYRDALVSRVGLSLEQMTEEHTIATSSLRRRAQIKAINPKVQVVDIRGNVDTRLRKMHDGYCHAMMMAGAGLIRLGYDHEIHMLMEPVSFVPAPGQGAVAIELLDGAFDVMQLIAPLHCSATASMVMAERAFLNELQGGCHVPIGSHAVMNHDLITLYGMVAAIDGSVVLRDLVTGSVEEAELLGRDLAQRIKQQGGDDLLNIE